MSTLFINGTWSEASDGATRTITCPATGETVGTVAEGGEADAIQAINAARAAFDDGAWSATPGTERGLLLNRLADKLEAELDEVARLEALDTGKRFVEAQGDMGDIVNVFRYYGGLAGSEAGRITDPCVVDVSSRVVAEPVGVCALITPWNFPLLQTAWKVAPALAAGNTFVLKPSELTPHSTIWLMEALDELGLPKGVGNLVLGPGHTVGATMSSHPEVDLVSFTGGLQTGRTIMAAASTTVKRVALELGGKNPNIVFADANLDAAIDNALTAIFLDSGQVCSAGARLIVEDSIHDEVVAELVRRADEIVLGSPFDEKAQSGALISETHLQKVDAYVQAAKAEGAELLAGGYRETDGDLGKGWFYRPTILGGCDTSMTCVQDESFGPVLTVERFSGDSDQEREDAAVALANDTIYGLAGAVWSENSGRCERVAKRLRHGTIWINDYHPYVPAAEWGGMKQSGNGRELGLTGLHEYQELKHIWHNTRPARADWFPDSAQANN